MTVNDHYKESHFGTRVRTLYVFLRTACVQTVTSDRVHACSTSSRAYAAPYFTHVTKLKFGSYIHTHTSEGGTTLISKLVAHLKNKNWLQFEVDKASAWECGLGGQ